jgi:hypothetical protein
MSRRAKDLDAHIDISSLIARVNTLELVTFGDFVLPQVSQGSFVVGTVHVPTLSASAAAFVPAASVHSSASASVSVSVSEKSSASSGLFKSGSSVSLKQILITPLAGRLRGGGPTSEGQASELGEMIVIKPPDQFLARWATLSEEEREAFELEQASNPEQAVVNEALKKNHLRTSQLLKAMAQQLSESKADAAATRAAADAAIAAQAQQAAQVSKSEAIKPRAPPSYENKEKDLPIQKWLQIVESYLAECLDKDYLRNASSFLAGKPRSFWQSKYDPPIDNLVEFFREVMLSAYGLKDDVQRYWDTWNKLHQKAGKDISEYNIAFEQARTDLTDEIHDEQVFIEKYKSGLQKDIRELARVSPSGKRWTSLKDLMEYCTLQWPTIQARLERSGKSGNKGNSHSVKVGGKRKATSPNRSGKSQKTSSETGNFPRLTAVQKAKNIAKGRCHICGSTDHFSKGCPQRTVKW